MNIGLVLSGGLGKGAYQIGALKALQEILPREEIKCISGASIGVLNGYAYMTGGLCRAEQMWKDICSNDNRLFVNQILRSSMLQQNIRNIYAPEKPLPVEFYASLLDIGSRSVVYKDISTVKQEQLPLYLKACVAMPVFNRAVQIDDGQFFDGGLVDNIPVFPLLKKSLDYIICIYFDDICYKFENTCFDNRIIKVTFPNEGMVKQSVVLEQDGIEHMINSGYERTAQLLKCVFSEGYDELSHIYRTIECMNQSKVKSLRVTGDVLITNLNKVTQKLARKKIL